MVTPAGVEPAIFWMRTRRPGPLDEGAILLIPQIPSVHPRGVRCTPLL